MRCNMLVNPEAHADLSSGGFVPGPQAVPPMETITDQETLDGSRLVQSMLGRLAAEKNGSDPVRAAFSYAMNGGYIAENRMRHSDHAYMQETATRPNTTAGNHEAAVQPPAWSELSLEDFLECYFSIMHHVGTRAAKSGLNPFRTGSYREPDAAERALGDENWQEMLYRRGYWPGDIEDVEQWQNITLHSGSVEQALYDASTPYDEIEEARANDLYRIHRSQAGMD